MTPEASWRTRSVLTLDRGYTSDVGFQSKAAALRPRRVGAELLEESEVQGGQGEDQVWGLRANEGSPLTVANAESEGGLR